jgi:hypothetical protein
VFTASGDQALLLSRKCQLLQEEKTEKKNVENNGEKAYLYFYRQNLLLFCSASSVCKIDITLYIVTFLEITAWLCHRLSHPYRQGQKNRQEIGFLVVVRIYI